MNRFLAGSAVALALMLPRPAAAEVNLDDLMEAAESIIEALIEQGELAGELVLARLEQLLGVAETVPSGNPVIEYPTTYADSVEFSEQLQLDRKARADATDELTSTYLQLAPQVADELVALEQLNAAGCVSVSACIALGNQAELLATNELSLTTAAVMAQTRLATDQARQQIEAVARKREWAKAYYGDSLWDGNRSWPGEQHAVGW